MKKILTVAVAALVVVLAAVLLWPRAPMAPHWNLTDLNGRPVGSAQLAGKVSLVNFWYPSCPGCVGEMPKLIQMAQDYRHRPDFQIIGVALPYDPESSVRHYVHSRQIPFAVAIDSQGEVGRRHGVQVAPTTVLIDRAGRIQKTFVGEPDFPRLYRQVDDLLAP